MPGLELVQKAHDESSGFAETARILRLPFPEHTLGLAYYKQGEYKKAVKHLKSAAKQLPEHEAIKRDLRAAQDKLQ